jgi:hypothetical protein
MPVDTDRLDEALHAVRALHREREVVAAVRRVCGLERGPISMREIQAHSLLTSRKSAWLGIREALAHGLIVGELRPGVGWALAIAPRYAARERRAV